MLRYATSRLKRRGHGTPYAYFPPYRAQFAGKAIDYSRTQSPVAPRNSDYCSEERLQLLVPLSFALLARIGIARYPDLLDENLRSLREFCVVDRGGRTREARRSHD